MLRPFLVQQCRVGDDVSFESTFNERPFFPVLDHQMNMSEGLLLSDLSLLTAVPRFASYRLKRVSRSSNADFVKMTRQGPDSN